MIGRDRVQHPFPHLRVAGDVAHPNRPVQGDGDAVIFGQLYDRFITRPKPFDQFQGAVARVAGGRRELSVEMPAHGTARMGDDHGRAQGRGRQDGLAQAFFRGVRLFRVVVQEVVVGRQRGEIDAVLPEGVVDFVGSLREDAVRIYGAAG